MSTIFRQHLDYPNATTTLASGGYTAGSGVINLATGTGSIFGTPSSSSPLGITLASANTPSTCCHYQCTGRTGDQLTGVTVIDGTDQNFSSGDTCEGRVYASDFSTITGVLTNSLGFTAPAHEWINAIGSNGTPVASQPAFSDIAGTVGAGQLPNPGPGTLGGVESYTAAVHQWIFEITTSGTVLSSQPAFTDLSGSASVGQLPVMVASGASHSAGICPDPGSTAGTTHFLREDATWAVPAGGGGSPGGTNGQIQYDNSGAFGGFTMSGDATIVTSTGVITVTKTNGVAFANSATTDATNASNITSGTLATAQLPAGVPYALYRLGTSVNITASGSSSLLSGSTGSVGSLTIPLGALNSVGRILRIKFWGFVPSTAASSAGTTYFAFLLGGSVVCTTNQTNVQAGRSNAAFSGEILLTCKSTGSSGTVDTGGACVDPGSAFSGALLRSFCNGTSGGNQAAQTPPTVNWTGTLAMDFQINWSASTNSCTLTGCVIEISP